MKEFEVTVRVKNNRLLERRRRLGLTQKEVSLAADVPFDQYAGLETLRRRPVDDRGRWMPLAISLAGFYDVPPEELFPDAVLAIDKPVSVLALSGEALQELASGSMARFVAEDHASRLPAGPESSVEREELKRHVAVALGRLSKREAGVLRARFGIGQVEETLEELAAGMGVGGDRVRQIETKALSKLRHPVFHRGLKDFLEPDAAAAKVTR